MESVKRFLTTGNGTGTGTGTGYGYGYGYGNGTGTGYGYGYGNGTGTGTGDGYGYGYGYGNGNGDGDGIKSINNNPVYMIDDVPTVITRVCGNVAKGFILNDDLTLTPCYVLKSDNIFAHGETREKALEALQDKLFEDMDEDERIDAFLAEFNATDKYPAQLFFDWHHKLTGSCEMGRNTFVRNHEIDVENSEYTVSEFIALCENDYGGGVIKKLKERMSHESNL